MLSLVVFVIIFIVCSDDLITRMGNLTVWSVRICLTTIGFAVASVASAIAVWRAPAEGVRSGVRCYSMIVTLALLIALAYLACWGLIGLRTWA